MSDLKIKIQGVAQSLSEIDDIDVLKEYILKEKERHINSLNLNVSSENDIEELKLLISIFYEIKNHNKEKVVKNYIPEKFQTALCIYILYGYNKESKDKVKKVLGFTKQQQVNALNNNLRGIGLLYKDKMNNSISHLCDELKVIGEFYKKYRQKGKIGLRIVL